MPTGRHRHPVATAVPRAEAFHFCRQIGLSWSSSARALASATIASRAASHRSALANSWVDTAAPFTAPPSQLTTIRTWVIIGLDGPAERKPGAPDARGFCLGPAVSLRSAANACNRAVPKEPMARAGGLIHVKRGTANTLTKLSRLWFEPTAPRRTRCIFPRNSARQGTKCDARPQTVHPQHRRSMSPDTAPARTSNVSSCDSPLH